MLSNTTSIWNIYVEFRIAAILAEAPSTAPAVVRPVAQSARRSSSRGCKTGRQARRLNVISLALKPGRLTSEADYSFPPVFNAE